MMMDRSHLEHTLACHFEIANLNNITHGFNHKQAAKDNRQKFRMRGNGHGREQAAKR